MNLRQATRRLCLLASIDQALNQLRATGELRELSRKWHITIPE